MTGCELGNLQMMTEVIEIVRMLWGEQRWNPEEHSHLRSRQRRNLLGNLKKCLLFPVHRWMLSCVQLFATPWTIAHQAPLSMEFSRQRILEWVAIPNVFSWQELVSLCPTSFCTPRPNLPVTPGISWLPTFAFLSHIMKRTSFLGVSCKRSCRSS